MGQGISFPSHRERLGDGLLGQLWLRHIWNLGHSIKVILQHLRQHVAKHIHPPQLRLTDTQFRQEVKRKQDDNNQSYKDKCACYLIHLSQNCVQRYKIIMNYEL